MWLSSWWYNVWIVFIRALCLCHFFKQCIIYYIEFLYIVNVYVIPECFKKCIWNWFRNTDIAGDWMKHCCLYLFHSVLENIGMFHCYEIKDFFVVYFKVASAFQVLALIRHCCDEFFSNNFSCLFVEYYVTFLKHSIANIYCHNWLSPFWFLMLTFI